MTQPPQQMPPPPGWYPDPSGNPGNKYWDGYAWHSAVPSKPGREAEFLPGPAPYEWQRTWQPSQKQVMWTQRFDAWMVRTWTRRGSILIYAVLFLGLFALPIGWAVGSAVMSGVEQSERNDAIYKAGYNDAIGDGGALVEKTGSVFQACTLNYQIAGSAEMNLIEQNSDKYFKGCEAGYHHLGYK